MSRRPNLIPSQPLNVALSLPLYTQLSAHLYSELEGRVPYGAYSRFVQELVRDYFNTRHFDLSEVVDLMPGECIVSGTSEAISTLRETLQSLGAKK